MKTIIYETSKRCTKFFLRDPFTNELAPCSEEDFDCIVVQFRNAYDMKYDGPNAQNFYRDGLIEARVER